MSIATEIERLLQAKADLKISIEAKGVSLADDATLDDYPEAVDQIQTGGGGSTPDFIGNFSDGSITVNVNPSKYDSWYYMTQSMKSLQKVIFSEGVTNVTTGSFQNCTSLKEIVFPSTVTRIESNSFSECTKVNKVTCKAETPPSAYGISDWASNCEVYVPAASVDAYKAANKWSRYANTIYAINE